MSPTANEQYRCRSSPNPHCTTHRPAADAAAADDDNDGCDDDDGGDDGGGDDAGCVYGREKTRSVVCRSPSCRRPAWSFVVRSTRPPTWDRAGAAARGCFSGSRTAETNDPESRGTTRPAATKKLPAPRLRAAAVEHSSSDRRRGVLPPVPTVLRLLCRRCHFPAHNAVAATPRSRRNSLPFADTVSPPVLHHLPEFRSHWLPASDPLPQSLY